MTNLKSIPEGYHTVTPYLYVHPVAQFIDFLKRAFDAEQIEYHDLGGGHIHAEVRIGDSMIMIGGAPTAKASIYLYVPDVDALYSRAVAAGATSVEEPNDKPYGDRSAWVTDPFGLTWFIATRKEDMSSEEIERRMAER
jgi:PhnB protein